MNGYPRANGERHHGRRPAASALLLGVLLLAGGCRDGNGASASSIGPGAGGPVNFIVPSTAGTNGCNGADQLFMDCEEIDLGLALANASPGVSTLTRIAAAQSGSKLFYATATLSATGDSTVIELDLTDPANPLITHLIPVDKLDSLVSDFFAGPGVQAKLAGIAVLDADTVLVAELVSNTILAVKRSVPPLLLHYAGAPSMAPTFIDGAARSTAGFALDAESELCPTEGGIVFVADTGNNAIRIIVASSALDPNALVVTATGKGPAGAGFRDGDLLTAIFDAPTGLSAHCADRLIVTERGDSGAGHRLRSLIFTGFDPAMGMLDGMVWTEVGDGMPASSAGPSLMAQTAEPQAPAISSSGEVYWIDSLTGVLRRESVAGFVDCPLAPGGDCMTLSSMCPSAGPDFAPGASFSTAISGAGDLYVLQTGTTRLRRFGPP